jgi:cell wall-associated NlpC family hydrolase
MFSTRLFPYAVVACFTLSMSVAAVAQTSESRARRIIQLPPRVESNDPALLEDEPVVIAMAAPEDIKAPKILSTGSSSTFSFQRLISAAIDERLGARYRWGATGPSAYDCSGFVWSIFHSAGIDFERASARSLWAQFAPPAENEKYKFGTLVFFRNLAHVGIVADERGFYHASRHHGVIYSPFNEYWLSRLDGFRKVPTIVISQ